MPKTKQNLDVILQLRVSADGLEAIDAAAEAEHTSRTEWARRQLYAASGYTKRSKVRG